ncbi:sensor histidine kinase [Sedimenticola selenatireducens]|uniref:sensor histidine kinase n=1 Tax=Sedimenticola selenatireducens TaxID=191960 RepID=UPI00048FA442|nr:histidine kinase [Sedimenticola selenatireducens]
MPKYQPFKLLPFFSVTSLLGIVVAAALVTLLYRQTAIAELVDLGEQQNIGLAQTALNSVHEQLALFLRRANTGSQATDTEIETLEAKLKAVLRNTSVVRIKVYNQAGIVVFSTKRSQIGRDQSDNPAFVVARGGDITSKLIFRDHFNFFDQETEEDNLIQTYMPVGRDSEAAEIGVFEIYTDVNPLVADISHMEVLIVIGTGTIFLLLYALLLTVVHRAGRIIARQQLTIAERNKTLELLSAQLLDAQETERKRVAIELHEGIAQTLSAIKFHLEIAEQSAANGDEGQAMKLDGLVKVIQGTIQEVRTMAMQLRPPSLDDLGIGATLSWLSRQLSEIYPEISVEAQVTVDEERIPRQLRVVVYRTVQEALAAMTRCNVPRTIQLVLRESGALLRLEITDSAMSATAPLEPDLSIASQRILMSGGVFTVQANPSGGAVLSAEWDL